VRLLLIENEPRIVEVLNAALAKAGFAVDAVGTAAHGHEMLATVAYDAVILDLGLPDGDGLDLLAAARTGGNRTPVLILTARDAIEDRVRGLDTGADDYVVKPFAVDELLARIRALLRRPGGALGTVLVAGNLVLDTVGRDVTVGDTPVALSRREADILEQLLRRVGRVVPRAVLEEKLYGLDDTVASNAVPVHVHHLRRKLESCGATAHIHTIRGLGYLLGAEK
jgi:DNA-binding response OmpR family regulator